MSKDPVEYLKHIQQPRSVSSQTGMGTKPVLYRILCIPTIRFQFDFTNRRFYFYIPV